MQPPKAECRVSERRACQVQASCQPASANETRWKAVVEDISPTGLRIRLPRRFEPQTGLAVELPGKDGEDPSTIYARVVHVRSAGDGSWVLGCRLVGELSDDEVNRLATLDRARESGPPPAPAAVEPERTTVTDLRLFVATPDGRYTPYRVRRFRVSGAWPLPPGTALDLRGLAARGVSAGDRFSVVECAQESDGWALRVRPLDSAAVS
jgi:hypothetical protein